MVEDLRGPEFNLDIFLFVLEYYPFFVLSIRSF